MAGMVSIIEFIYKKEKLNLKRAYLKINNLTTKSLKESSH